MKDSRYPEYKSLNLPEIAAEVQRFWEENNIPKRSVEEREGAPDFVFYEGPPSANGQPGIHHAMARTIKDIFCRYKTQKGYRVERKGGWDTHGLPVELQVEKKLGIRKEDIGTKISIEEFNRLCKESVMEFVDVWEESTNILGFWIDMENPYITYEKNYIETLWWILKTLHSKDLLYKGYSIQPYSPAAGTALSSHELSYQGTYRMVKDTSCTAQFKITNYEFQITSFGDNYFLAWTTTPWTLPANSALAVGENIVYSRIASYNQYTLLPVTVILAKELIGKYFKEEDKNEDLESWEKDPKHIPWKILDEYTGKELEGIRYEQLLPYIQPEGDAFRVIIGDFVSTEEGTGIVHISPTFGADDLRTALKNNIPSITVADEKNPNKQVPIVDRSGKFVKEITDFAGMYVKDYTDDPSYEDVNVKIVIKLKEQNKAFRVEKYEHSYPHCWRTDKPILYYPLDAWFIKTTAYKDRMVELNKTINWKPASTGEGRFGNWLENMVDWNLSRTRYWATPLPVWLTEDDAEMLCIGSVEELHNEIEKAIQAGFMRTNPVLLTSNNQKPATDFDLHLPYVDEITLVSPSGKPMKRTPEVIDVWFDSGAMPYAQQHYPFENKETFKKSFPADFIAEGVDQTRGWFYTLHALAVMLFDSVAYKNVISNGLVLDKLGNKMSKSKGNGVDPFETIKKYGPDATRWYMISNAAPWDNLKFDVDGISEVQRRFFGTLYNTYGFFALYSNIDSFRFNEENRVSDSYLTELDRWIISKLNSLLEEVTEYYEDYEPHRAARAIETFVDEHLSNWYVRLSRRRFWKGEMSADKQAAYETLYDCLNTLSQLIAPIAPFFAEWLYGNLHAGKNSVHLSILPTNDASKQNTKLEERMELAQDITSMVLSLRKREKLRVRQPLQKILIPVTCSSMEENIRVMENYILNELNIKTIEYISGGTGIISKKMKPDFKKLGPKYGQKMKQIQQAVNELPATAVNDLEIDGKITLNLSDEVIDLLLEEVEIVTEDIPGWIVTSNGKLTVALDITITPELKNEGLARELVNRIQNLRKSRGLEVTDHIHIRLEGNEVLQEAIENFRNYICTEILADSLELTDSLNGESEILDIEEISTKVELKKA